MSRITYSGPDRHAAPLTDWQRDQMAPSRFESTKDGVFEVLSRATWRDALLTAMFALAFVAAVLALAIDPATSSPSPQAASGAHSLAPAIPARAPSRPAPGQFLSREDHL